tara:strand:- start:2733 stop:3197 length:465 start_codon:yes stop_codon:yes gene_type:complete
VTQKKYLSLIIILIITFTASYLGSFVTTAFKEPWYSSLTLPSFNPPSWVFPPVWTSLYFMMSIAIWIIWINFFDKDILKIYFIHLFFNSIWSVIFFGFHFIGLALIDLLIILIFIVILMKIYYNKNRLSFYLMIPYFLWSTYALVLNFTIFIIN